MCSTVKTLLFSSVPIVCLMLFAIYQYTNIGFINSDNIMCEGSVYQTLFLDNLTSLKPEPFQNLHLFCLSLGIWLKQDKYFTDYKVSIRSTSKTTHQCDRSLGKYVCAAIRFYWIWQMFIHKLEV